MNTEPTAAETPVPAPKTLCANCGTELLGPHCYACGQPVKGMVRHLGSIMHDVADTILNIDSRIFRTLLPLYVRPGYLSMEYFAGRRVRYVTPFRLYFFLSVAAFLLIQIGLDSSLDLARNMVQISSANTDIANARTPADVERLRDTALAEIEKQKAAPDMPHDAVNSLDRAEEQVRRQAEKRLQKLERRAQADPAAGEPAGAASAAAGKATENSASDEDGDFEFGGKRWDPKADPIRIAWMPEYVNAKLNNAAVRMRDNLPRIKKDPKPFLLGTFSVLPQVLFVLMPLFALLLKVFYIFKRRLYMEHLIVALHSHSFIFMSLILITLAMLVRAWARVAAPWLASALGWVLFAMWWWLPIYLFVMQKKVYKQGWFFTSLKYSMIGICYTIMITLGVVAALMVSLATT
jgi:hypothetical protein